MPRTSSKPPLTMPITNKKGIDMATPTYEMIEEIESDVRSVMRSRIPYKYELEDVSVTDESGVFSDRICIHVYVTYDEDDVDYDEAKNLERSLDNSLSIRADGIASRHGWYGSVKTSVYVQSR